MKFALGDLAKCQVRRQVRILGQCGAMRGDEPEPRIKRCGSENQVIYQRLSGNFIAQDCLTLPQCLERVMGIEPISDS